MEAAAMSAPTSVLIIAHNPLLREGIAALLNEQADLTAVTTLPE